MEILDTVGSEVYEGKGSGKERMILEMGRVEEVWMYVVNSVLFYFVKCRRVNTLVRSFREVSHG
jgi:hypothetical protein